MPIVTAWSTPGAAMLITFLVTASGFSSGGLGSAFWGLIAGSIALLLRPRVHWRPRVH